MKLQSILEAWVIVSIIPRFHHINAEEPPILIHRTLWWAFVFVKIMDSKRRLFQNIVLKHILSVFHKLNFTWQLNQVQLKNPVKTKIRIFLQNQCWRAPYRPLTWTSFISFSICGGLFLWKKRIVDWNSKPHNKWRCKELDHGIIRRYISQNSSQIVYFDTVL